MHKIERSRWSLFEEIVSTRKDGDRMSQQVFQLDGRLMPELEYHHGHRLAARLRKAVTDGEGGEVPIKTATRNEMILVERVGDDVIIDRQSTLSLAEALQLADDIEAPLAKRTPS